jgi:hypothetical protein
MQMKRVRFTLVLALLALSTFGWRAAAADSGGPLPLDGSRGIQTFWPVDSGASGDPDVPQVTKRLSRAPGSDGGRGLETSWQRYRWMGRVWVGVYLGRWIAR